MSTNHVPDNVIDQLRDNLRAAGIQAAEPDIQGIVAKGFLSRLLDFERAVARVPIDTVPDYLAAWGAADQSGLPNQSSAEAWLPDSPIQAIAVQIRARQVSPVELAEQALARIAERDPVL